mgnify:CR=1 FL=1
MSIFEKKDGSHMILPHYVAIYSGGEITINEEYSDFAWVDINRLEEFEPKIENITDEEYLRSVSAHRIEPCYETPLVLSSIVYDIGADMCIG